MMMAGHRQPIVGHAGTTTTSGWPPVSTADADTYGSSSTLSAEATTGSHVYKVAHYSGFKGLQDAGWQLPSDTFTVGGCSWRITYTPRDTEDWICFGLCLHEPPPAGGGAATDVDGKVVRTRYTLLDQAGQPVPSSVREESECTLSSLKTLRQTQFMKRKKFECYYLKENRFSVRCDVTLVTRTCRLSGAMPPPDLRRHLGNLLASGVGADVTFEVGGEAFLAHRSILASRSPVFKAELFGGRPPPDKVEDAAAAMSRVRIRDIEPSVFRALLCFIYTDSLPETGAGEEMETARRLLVAAERYELDGLKWICEGVLGLLLSSCPSLLDQMHAKV